VHDMSRLPPRQQVLAETATPTRVNAAASRRQSAAAATSNKYRALCTPSRASTAPKPTTLKRQLITHGKTDDATKKRKCDPMPMASRKTSMSMSNTGGIATSGGTDEAVKVAVRVRPFAPEGNQCADRAWGVSTEQNSIVELSSESKDPYEYDQVFGEDSNTRTIYDALVSGVVSSVAKDGINGTVFTYGQTGSGKTFTMQGCKKSKSDGIVQLAARDIFQSIEERQKMNDDNDNEDDAGCTVRVSYVEIYNEELRDLLNGNSRKSSSSLIIREDKHGLNTVDGLNEVVVESFDHLINIFKAGEKKRSVGSTKMNDRSSRSHAILSITLERKTTTSAPKNDADEQKENSDHNRATQSKLVVVKTTSTLNLVDLAGSESVRHTNAVGKQKEEGGMINQR
jgi:centromeric protein E